MSMRRAVAAATGVLLGMSVLTLTASPAQAAPRQDTKSNKSPVTVAHRGASGYAPENTLAAVSKADKLGFDWVENDVQRTKDGELVVMHDTTLSRTTNAESLYPKRSPWKVSDFTAKEISRLDAGSWFSDDYAGEKVPTLEQYLRHITKSGQKLLLELKAPELYPGVEAQTLRELRSEGWLDSSHLKSKLVIQSFNANSVRTTHVLNSGVKTGFLGNPKVSELDSYAQFTDQINPTHSTVTKDYVKAVHARKGPLGKQMQVFTWTVNDASTARTVDKAGVDGIISNFPDVVRDATGG
ncbi:glycerophosphodiester phosphodiesterase [Streptomyces abyssalis]|uniref:Glycerophosphodiester phosphodiesterase n=1 Tax=Streptomyces abyssalis TaxID=933944 RepID=A0A1E7JL85_9ACTN|nr:glycerophosphodiester phosphodiesterase family protein [Streptomyces abyssalis]OEU88407.1 glycerophosphodiester phosphodiesterase [Streptomyces abyssalis]OEU89145.1 glycerophosphodiester phosphodiesterase [Streptomyces abyssalis]OEV29288.1 glycerophosphodiester phosphodiesterase [Streptomyces nanshensis]